MGVSEYLLLAITHPSELRALAQYSLWYEKKRDITAITDHATSGWDRESMRECWRFLDLTSRSFSAVIKELDGDLARVICIFYIVLRALDTIEDDMTIPNTIKLPLLRTFHEKLYEPGWNFQGNGENEKDRIVVAQFDVVIEEFQRLDKDAQEVIARVCRMMGNGMADFAALSTPEQPVAEVSTLEDFSLYCHYVAGLVGEGLSGLFSVTGKERPWLKDQLVLSNSMGLLLQKTNILRDYREDADDNRGFWPKEVYNAYGFENLKDMRDPSRRKDALWVLSAMTVDAIGHSTDALDYLCLLKNQSVFNFCSIPAVMAIATLELCFMNEAVFERNIKIRKGEAVQLILKCTNPRDVAYIFRDYVRKIHKKAVPADPNFLKISIACGKVEAWCEHQYPSFIEIRKSESGTQTVYNASTNDARLRIQKSLTEASQQRAEAKRLADRAAWRVAKGLPPLGEGVADAPANGGEGFPMLWIGLFLVGLLAVMGIFGLGLAWVIVTYFD